MQHLHCRYLVADISALVIPIAISWPKSGRIVGSVKSLFELLRQLLGSVCFPQWVMPIKSSLSRRTHRGHVAGKRQELPLVLLATDDVVGRKYKSDLDNELFVVEIMDWNACSGNLVLWTWQVPLQAALRLKFGGGNGY